MCNIGYKDQTTYLGKSVKKTSHLTCCKEKTQTRSSNHSTNNEYMFGNIKL